MASHNCPKCDKHFTNVSNLYRHLKRIHQIENYSALVKGAGGLKFAETEQFEAWKRKVEEEDGAFFVVSSSRKMSDGRKSYYVCNRSGAPRTIPDSKRKRHSKYIGSSKINANCPARFTARFSSQGILVKDFHRPHSGHKSEPYHLPIPTKVKERIANELAAKVPYDYILDTTLSNEPAGNISRIKLMSTQDIRNIAAQFGVEQEGKMHADDQTSVKAWVLKERAKGKESCILLYKPLGEYSLDLGVDDFLLAVMTSEQEEVLNKFSDKLVAIDSTRGTKAYQFEITTLLVSDEYGQGFPVAFLFSNKTDEHFVELFLTAVREKAGAVNPKVFMSDADELFHNAWLSAMGVSKCETRLLSSWRVLRDWRYNLNSIKDEETRNEAWKTLRVLLIEPDQETFREMLLTTLDWLCIDMRTAKFGNYFRDQYADNYTMWAYSFRRGLGVNTRMHIERFHRGLKHNHATARVPKRLDMTIHNLLRLTRRRFADRARFKSKLKLKCPQSRHDSSLMLSEGDVLSTSGMSWSVFSSDSVNVYEVKLEQPACSCTSVCIACDTCCHQFSCTCHDYVISANMCKHVHLVSRVTGVFPFGVDDGAGSYAGLSLADTNSQLDDAESQIADTVSQIDCTELQIDDAESRIADTVSQIDDKEWQLDGAELQPSDTVSQSDDTEFRLDDNKSQLADTLSQIDDTDWQPADMRSPSSSSIDDQDIENRKVVLCELAESIIGKCSNKRELHLVEQCLKKLDFNLAAKIEMGDTNAIY